MFTTFWEEKPHWKKSHIGNAEIGTKTDNWRRGYGLDLGFRGKTVNISVKYPRYRPTWPRGVQQVKAPRFHDTRHTKVVRLSPLRTGRLYPQEYPGTQLQRLSRPQATWTCWMLRKKSYQWHDRGSFRLVAQRLNHYATPGPCERFGNKTNVWVAY